MPTRPRERLEVVRACEKGLHYVRALLSCGNRPVQVRCVSRLSLLACAPIAAMTNADDPSSHTASYTLISVVGSCYMFVFFQLRSQWAYGIHGSSASGLMAQQKIT